MVQELFLSLFLLIKKEMKLLNGDLWQKQLEISLLHTGKNYHPKMQKTIRKNLKKWLKLQQKHSVKIIVYGMEFIIVLNKHYNKFKVIYLYPKGNIEICCLFFMHTICLNPLDS